MKCYVMCCSHCFRHDIVSVFMPRTPRSIGSPSQQGRGGPHSTGQENLSKLAGSSRSSAASESTELADRMGGASDRSRADNRKCCPAGCTCFEPHRCPYHQVVCFVGYPMVRQRPRHNGKGGAIAAIRNVDTLPSSFHEALLSCGGSDGRLGAQTLTS